MKIFGIAYVLLTFSTYEVVLLLVFLSIFLYISPFPTVNFKVSVVFHLYSVLSSVFLLNSYSPHMEKGGSFHTKRFKLIEQGCSCLDACLMPDTRIRHLSSLYCSYIGVRISRGLGAGWLGSDSCQRQDFSLLIIQTSSGAHPTSYQTVDTGAVSLGVKWPGHGTAHFHLVLRSRKREVTHPLSHVSPWHSHSLTHGGEPSLRSCQLCSHSNS
jgi:hypothetical protein